MPVLSNLVRSGPLRTLALSTFINNAGNGAFATTAVVYLNQVRHIPAAAIGAGFTVASIAGVLASLPAGMLADRRNPSSQAAWMAIAAGLASGLYAVVGNAWTFAAVAIGYAVAERGSTVARQTLIGTVFTSTQRSEARATLRSVSNLGTALGAGAAALVLADGHTATFRLLFLLNALSYVVAGAVLSGVRPRAEGDHGETAPMQQRSIERKRSQTVLLRDRPYAIVSAFNALLTVHVVVLEVVLPLWVVSRTQAPRVVIALLLLANTGLVVVGQVPVSRRFDTVVKAVAGIRLAAVLLVLMFLSLALSAITTATVAILLLILATAAQTGAEMVQGAASWPLSYDLAPPGQLGEYQGFFSLAEQLVQTAGPAGFTLLLIEWHGPGALVLAGTYAVVATIAPAAIGGQLARGAVSGAVGGP